MATPFLIVQNVNLTIIPGTPGQQRIDTFDSAGSALSVASGYTVDFVNAVPATDANPLVAPVELVADFSKAFDATGVTLSWTAAQAATIAAALSTLRSSIGIALSNDTGTTATLAASGSLTVENSAEFQAA